MSGGKVKVEPYGLAPDFERAVATAVCKSARFYSMVGSAIEVEAIVDPNAALAIRAAQAIAHDVGKGPGSMLIVLQRLARWKEDGRVTQQKIESVADMFDAAEDAGMPADELLLNELSPVLQTRAKQSVVRAALDDFAKGGDLQKVERAVSKARAIGRTADIDGAILSGLAFDAIDALRVMERLPTGVPELDLILDGGYPRGLTVFVGDSGAGKSLALSSSAAEAATHGLHVGIASLELPEELQLARVIANLTAVPINDITGGRAERAKQRLAQMLPKLGILTARYFAPRATKVDDLFRWVEQREQKVGRKMDLLVVDYLDKLSSGSSDDSEYKAQGDIADALRDRAIGRGTWCITASQAKRRDGKGKEALDLHHVADSMHKVRVADVMAMLRKDEEAGTLDIFLAKYRLGKGRVGTGPLPMDEACGRIAPVTREWGW